MPLINTARAMDSDRFRWRVAAAALQIAAEKINDPDPQQVALAQKVLDTPMQEQRTLTALCAVNPSISAKVKVDDATNTVDTEEVPDSDIIYAVNVSWPIVAKRSGAA